MNNNLTKIILALFIAWTWQVVTAQCTCCMATNTVDTHAYHHLATSDTLDADQVQKVLTPYLQLQKALAADNLDAAKTSGVSLQAALYGSSKLVKQAASMIAEAEDIKTAREAFLPISELLIASAEKVSLPGRPKLFKAHCPMAFNNKGGAWLQDESVLANPYYGAMMLRCGTIKPMSSP